MISGMKNKLFTTLGVASAAFAFAPSALAQDSEALGGTRHKKYESPQHFEVEFRFAPYRSMIDDDPALNGKTPFKDTFGTMPRLLVAAELDWQVLRIPHLGSIGPGVSIGYTTMGAQATKKSDGSPSASETSLDVFPLYGVAVLRADVFMKDFGIPLVPYAKAGVGYALWRSYTTGGTSEVDTPGGGTVSGKGHTWGTHFAAGLQFQMNVLDPQAARAFDDSLGVNNTYLYGEWMFENLDGLGQTSALRVGTSTWVAGLAFEF